MSRAVILLDTNICIHVIDAKPPAVLERQNSPKA
jgi:predicted nucleic acid-binding protein